MKNGIWSEDEHDRFLLAIKEFPRGPWSSIAQAVGTRSVRQVQTHTQKYYEKILRRMRGLRKDRKTWARVEHRIDDDILAFCELMKGKKDLTISASVPTPAQIAAANDMASPPRGRGLTASSSSISPSNSPRKFSSRYAFPGGIDMEPKAVVFPEICVDWSLESQTRPLPLPLPTESADVELDSELQPLETSTMDLPPLEDALDFFIQVMH